MRGFTLVELVVGLTVLGLALAFTGLAWTRASVPPAADVMKRIEETRRVAVREGRMTTWTDSVSLLRFWPDGSTSGGTITVEGVVLVIEPLDGTIRAQR